MTMTTDALRVAFAALAEVAGAPDGWLSSVREMEDLAYPGIAGLGRLVFAAQLAGRDAEFVVAFYGVVERALLEGDLETKNLIVVGLFESLQGYSYHRGEADLVERQLGPTSRLAWSDLLEGWTGGGVRTILVWRRVIRNGAVARVEWTHHATGATRIVDWSTDSSHAPALQAALRPWIARAVATTRPVPERWNETLRITSSDKVITLHAHDRWLFDGERWFEASIAALPWPDRDA